MALHLDHLEDESLWRVAADAGFFSVMVDAGARPYAKNVAATRDAADELHAAGLWVEAADVDLVAALAERVPVPLVLHGSSGVPDGELRRAIAAGMTKINIGTALNVAMTGAVRTVLDTDESLVDPRRYLDAGRRSMGEAVAALLEVVSPPRR